MHGWNGTQKISCPDSKSSDLPHEPSLSLVGCIKIHYGHSVQFIFNSMRSLFSKPRFDNASYFVSYNLLTVLSILPTFLFAAAAAAGDIYKMALRSQKWNHVYNIHLTELISSNSERTKLRFKIFPLSSHLCIAFYDFWSILIILPKLIFAKICLNGEKICIF